MNERIQLTDIRSYTYFYIEEYKVGVAARGAASLVVCNVERRPAGRVVDNCDEQ